MKCLNIFVQILQAGIWHFMISFDETCNYLVTFESQSYGESPVFSCKFCKQKYDILYFLSMKLVVTLSLLNHKAIVSRRWVVTVVDFKVVTD